MKDPELLKQWLETNGVSVTKFVKKIDYSRAAYYKQMNRKNGFSDAFKEALEEKGVNIYANQLETIKVDTAEYDHYVLETMKAKDAVISAKDMVISEKDLRIKNLEDIIGMLREKNTTVQKIEAKIDQGVQRLIDAYKASSIRVSK